MKGFSLKPASRRSHPKVGRPPCHHGIVELRQPARHELPALVEVIREHAAFERAPPPVVSVQALEAVLFSSIPILHCWMAVIDDAAAAYMTATCEYSTWSGRQFLHMDCLYVRAHYRNCGIGARLLDVLSEFASDKGIVEIQWQTPHWNEDAARFYRRLGAVESMKRRFALALAAPTTSFAPR